MRRIGGNRALPTAGQHLAEPPPRDQASAREASFLDAIAEEALGVDRVEAQPVLELLAQLADVALDDILIDVLVEETVDRVEDLGLADASAAATQQKLEDAPLPPRW